MMKKFYFYLMAFIFFAVTIFFVGIEVAHTPISNEIITNINFAETNNHVQKMQMGISEENQEIATIERIKGQELKTQSIFSKVGTWLGESISEGFVQVLEKIFS